MDFYVDDGVEGAISNFSLPENLSFGNVMLPVMFQSNYSDGQWGPLELVPYHTITMDPSCKVLHYGQEIFEGMKAYRNKSGGPFLFRPDENMVRFNYSARRMAMPEIPNEYFMTSVRELTSYCAQFVPTESESSLYLRPFMYNSDNSLGIDPKGNFVYMLIASPSKGYFAWNSVKLLIERQAVRASPGGIGKAKTGGNYAASLKSMIDASKMGLDQVLWLDSKEMKYVEELSGMNFFAVYGETLVTPKLTGTILEGITRKSVIELSRHLGHKVIEESIDVNELCADIKAGKCNEAFACGTAVVITSIVSLVESDGTDYTLKDESGPVTKKLREHLVGIQEGHMEDPFGWRITVPSKN